MSGQETSNVRTGMELDTTKLANIASFMIQPITVHQFKLGQSNPTYLLTDASKRQFVLRRKPTGLLISSTAHAVDREFKILQFLSTNSEIPVPKVYLYSDDDKIIGSPFYIMQFIKGRIFTDMLLPTQNSNEKNQLYTSMILNLAKLHKIDPTLLQKNVPTLFYQRQIKSLYKISKAQSIVSDDNKNVGEIPDIDFLMDWFKSNMVPDKIAIIHGDYKLDNVIIDNSLPNVIGILDWELSTIGNPFSDLANMILPFYTSIPGFGVSSENDLPTRESLINFYCKEMGIPYPKELDFYIAFAFFRMSVILQGIAARIKRKQASSAQAERYAKMFIPVGMLAIEIAKRGDLNVKGKI